MAVPLWIWVGTIAVILAMLAVDLLAHRKSQVVTAGNALVWSAIWIACGVAFGGAVWARFGATHAGEYFGGYLLEKSLAVDNLFVFALIFASFAVPKAYQHRVLYFGVLGALVMRGAVIAGGSALLARFHWVLYLFGAFLLVTAWRMLRDKDGHRDPHDSRTMRAIRRVLPIADDVEGERFTVRRGGRLVATPLLVVLALIEVSDLVFAVDSIPAVFAVTEEPFLVFTSNAFAILGLRSLYFLLADLLDRFTYLNYGLAAVLGFVGVKLLLVDVVHIPITVSLAVIGGCLAVAVVVSLRRAPTEQIPEPVP